MNDSCFIPCLNNANALSCRLRLPVIINFARNGATAILLPYFALFVALSRIHVLPLALTPQFSNFRGMIGELILDEKSVSRHDSQPFRCAHENASPHARNRGHGLRKI